MMVILVLFGILHNYVDKYMREIEFKHVLGFWTYFSKNRCFTDQS